MKRRLLKTFTTKTTQRKAENRSLNLCVWESAAVDKSVSFEGVNRIFGYGSLCWKPPCDEREIVKTETVYVKDLKRRFWQSSCDHRGTPEYPGLVVTLLGKDHPDYGDEEEENQVFGVCFSIRKSYLSTILPDLDYRERHGYTRTLVDTFDPKTKKSLGSAIVYLAKPGNDPAYAGPLEDNEIGKIISNSTGPSGTNIGYFNKLLKFCESHGWRDAHLKSIQKSMLT